MIRSRFSRRAAAKRRPLLYAIEALEQRQLLAAFVLHGGDTFDFRSPDKNFERVSVFGSPSDTVELIGMGVDSMTGAQMLMNMQGILTSGGSFIGTPENGGIEPMDANPFINETIFMVYVSQATPSTVITVEEISVTAPNPPLAFSGTIPGIRAFNAQTGQSFMPAVPQNTGPALLGALTVNPSGGGGGQNDSIPIGVGFDTVPVPGGTFATLPATMTQIHPGLVVASNVALGGFYFGGTVTGHVDIEGSIGTFYAGWLLTGDAKGLPYPDVDDPQNFTVAGDIQNLLSKGAIGTETDTGLDRPDYNTGFDMRVGGRLGVVNTGDSFIGNINVTNSSTFHGLNYGQNEFELETTPAATPQFDPFSFSHLGRDPFFNNDTFQTAQYLGSPDPSGTVSVTGVLQALPAAPITDYVDWYAVPLMAGQTVTVQLTEQSPEIGAETGAPIPILATTPNLDVGVFDPYDRQVASDYNVTDLPSTEERPFRFTPAVPGIYRFAVSWSGNIDFTQTAPATNVEFLYGLSIYGVGNLSFGALVATNNILPDFAGTVRTGGTVGFQPTFHDGLGDLGAVEAGGLIMSSVVTVDHGDLRSLEATSIGHPTGGMNFNDPSDAFVPQGSVGLVRSTGTSPTADSLLFNVDLETSFLENKPGVSDLLKPFAIGGNYQLVDSATDLLGILVANGSIGVVRAASMRWDNNWCIFDVNAQENPSTPATIDLIDVSTGDLGSLSAGGPAIRTGPSGDVRYIHVGPNSNVFRDAFFGGGTNEATVFQPGEAVNLTDDSGTPITLTPMGGVPNPRFKPTLPVSGTNQQYLGPATLTITTYPIEGSGGSAIVNVTSTDSVSITSGGPDAEIGTINLQGAGQPVVIPPGAITTGGSGNFPGAGQPGGPPASNLSSLNAGTLPLPQAPLLQTPATTPMTLALGGGASVWSITGGAFSSITDDSAASEIVTMNVTSVGTLTTAGSLGVTQSHLGVDVQGEGVQSNLFPYNQQRNLVHITGNVVSISAAQVGNLQIDGNAGSISGTVNGPVVVNGALNAIDIGGGIAAQGNGNLARAGVFAVGPIGNVTNSRHGDIRGPVTSQTGIVSLTLQGGSIIDTFVTNYTQFSFNRQEPQTVVIFSAPTPITRPVLDIGSIQVTGNGGIIGTTIAGDHIGPISVNGGFGIFDSAIDTLAEGTVQSVTATGYGFRGGIFSGGASLGSLVAMGNGQNVPTTNYSIDVRPSDQGYVFDPNTGFQLSPLDDINIALGALNGQHQVLGETDLGIIEGYLLQGSRNVGSIRAYSIRAGVGPGEIGDSIFNVGNQIGSITTAGPIEGLSITAGRFGNFAPGGDVGGLNVTVAGPITKMVFRSGLESGSTIASVGPKGRIGTLIIHGNMNGTISSVTGIGRLVIDGSLTGNVKARSLGSLSLGQGMGNGSLTIDGKIGTIQTKGDLGAPGSTLTITGSIGTLKVGGNLNSNVVVAQNMQNLIVGGSIIPGVKITVGNTLANLRVNGNVDAGVIIKAHILRHKVIKGQMLGQIILT